mgnify:CR=1 FL=1
MIRAGYQYRIRLMDLLFLIVHSLFPEHFLQWYQIAQCISPTYTKARTIAGLKETGNIKMVKIVDLSSTGLCLELYVRAQENILYQFYSYTQLHFYPGSKKVVELAVDESDVFPEEIISRGYLKLLYLM